VRYAYTTLFSRSYGNLAAAAKKKINAAITKFSKKPHHPFPRGLRVHKLGGVSGAVVDAQTSADIWEMHASKELLITFQYGKGEVIFRNCGLHDAVLKSP
jgi:mRNA-degrading endonuclease YafQ of YafQ-DinJ toxin-antitoxin module